MARLIWVHSLVVILIGGVLSSADEPNGIGKLEVVGEFPFHDVERGVVLLPSRQSLSADRFRLREQRLYVTKAFLGGDPLRLPLLLEFTPDGGYATLHLPAERPAENDIRVLIEVASASQQFIDGRIVLLANDAKVLPATGKTEALARFESRPGNPRIGSWTNADETVAWSHTATRPGMYDVELTYSGEGVADTEVEIKIGDRAVPLKLADTGSWNKYTTGVAGRVYLPAAGPISIAVRCLKQTGPSVMNLKAITLRPACEGAMPEQADDGVIACHARDATIQGVKAQYEPRPEKNTIGYWVNERDWVFWDFTVKQPGEFEIEILQGCGAGHGGSEAQLILAGKPFPFTVEDTGHFQNFKPRVIGRIRLEPGQQRLAVVPVKKAKLAVMDLRQVRLIPVAAD